MPFSAYVKAGLFVVAAAAALFTAAGTVAIPGADIIRTGFAERNVVEFQVTAP